MTSKLQAKTRVAELRMHGMHVAYNLAVCEFMESVVARIARYANEQEILDGLGMQYRISMQHQESALRGYEAAEAMEQMVREMNNTKGALNSLEESIEREIRAWEQPLENLRGIMVTAENQCELARLKLSQVINQNPGAYKT